MEPLTFQAFPKLARLKRDVVITEKIDGTNAQILITEDGQIAAASRTRLITPWDDNFGFATWVEANKAELLTLGPGRHYGEWWGSGIQRAYGVPKGQRIFSLFNTKRWLPGDGEPTIVLPAGVRVVPVLYQGPFDTHIVQSVMDELAVHGSHAVPFMDPEGVVIYHTAANIAFKCTFAHDTEGKGV